MVIGRPRARVSTQQVTPRSRKNFAVSAKSQRPDRALSLLDRGQKKVRARQDVCDGRHVVLRSRKNIYGCRCAVASCLPQQFGVAALIHRMHQTDAAQMDHACIDDLFHELIANVEISRRTFHVQGRAGAIRVS